MRKTAGKLAVRMAKSVFTLLLCLAMVLTLLSTELLAAENADDSDTSDETADTTDDADDAQADYDADLVTYASDELIIVYYDEPLSEDDVIESDETDDGETLSDVGILSQEELSTSDETTATAVLAQIDDDVTSVEEVIEILEDDPAVAYVQPNYSYSLLSVASESDASEDTQYYLYSSAFTDAWDYAVSDGSVTVAVLDTGCNLKHEDLTDTVNADLAYDVTTGKLLSKSGVKNNGDAIGHGTQVCGVISASASNGTGIAGASYNADILPIKVFDSSSACTTAYLIAAYAYLDSLIESGELTDLKVINMSIGYYSDGTGDADMALESAISDMLSEHDVLTVCAGGNGTNGSANTEYCYPADFEECLSVTAVTQSGANASFSDYNDAKDISAYGVDIYTTSASGGYVSVSGTSVAAPQAAAAAALLWAADGSLSAQEVVSILQDTADEVTSNVHEESGSAGILNAAAALAEVTDASSGGTTSSGSTSSSGSSSTGSTSSSGSSSTGSTSSSGSSSTGSSSSSGSAGSSASVSVSTSAQEEDDLSEAQDAETKASSWRYSDGQLINDATGESSISSLYTTDTNYPYSVWKESYGASYYGVATSADQIVKIAVSGGARVVIDVSRWQGTIDWAEVAAAGITGAIIRCGYGSDSTKNDDINFLENVQGALDNGIEIGIYLYSYALTKSGAASEAAHVLRLLEEAGLDPEDLDLPVYLDIEDSSQTSLSTAQYGTIAETFCDAIEEAGYAVGIYASMSWWNTYLTDEVFDNEDWYKWVARYPVSTSSPVTDCGIEDADMWQVSSHGILSGISENYVDISIDYVGSGGYATKPGKTTLSSATLSSDASSITLKWKKVSNVEGYRVYRKTGDGSYELVATIKSGSTLTWTDSSVDEATTYTYRVRAYRTTKSGTKVFGSYSGVKTVSTGPDTVTLTSLTATAKGSIKISWEQVSNADGYVIYRSVNGGEYTKLKTITDPEKTSLTNISVEIGSVYRYKIRAYILVGTKKIYSASYSNMKKMTAGPGRVTQNALTATSKGNIKISWEQVDGADGYVIYRSVDGGEYKKLKTITDPEKTSLTNISVTTGTVYRYKIRAYTLVDGKKVYSGSYSVVRKMTARPAKVSITSAAKTSSGYVQVKWSQTEGASGYVIYRSTNGGSYKKVKTIKSGSTVKWTDQTVKPGRVYRYKIKAYVTSNGANLRGSTWSSVKKVTAKPATVTIKSVSSSKTASGTVKWKSVSNATGYQVAYRIAGTSTWHYTTVTTNKKVFTNLKHKKYYVKVRAYKKYNGTKYYGSWSSSTKMVVK